MPVWCIGVGWRRDAVRAAPLQAPHPGLSLRTMSMLQGSSILCVGAQEMTYVKQLEDYEEAVMKKRLEEMPQAEKERLLMEIEAEKDGKKAQQSKP